MKIKPTFTLFSAILILAFFLVSCADPTEEDNGETNMNGETNTDETNGGDDGGGGDTGGDGGDTGGVNEPNLANYTLSLSDDVGSRFTFFANTLINKKGTAMDGKKVIFTVIANEANDKDVYIFLPSNSFVATQESDLSTVKGNAKASIDAAKSSTANMGKLNEEFDEIAYTCTTPATENNGLAANALTITCTGEGETVFSRAFAFADDQTKRDELRSKLLEGRAKFIIAKFASQMAFSSARSELIEKIDSANSAAEVEAAVNSVEETYSNNGASIDTLNFKTKANMYFNQSGFEDKNYISIKKYGGTGIVDPESKGDANLIHSSWKVLYPENPEGISLEDGEVVVSQAGLLRDAAPSIAEAHAGGNIPEFETMVYEFDVRGVFIKTTDYLHPKFKTPPEANTAPASDGYEIVVDQSAITAEFSYSYDVYVVVYNRKDPTDGVGGDTFTVTAQEIADDLTQALFGYTGVENKNVAGTWVEPNFERDGVVFDGLGVTVRATD